MATDAFARPTSLGKQARIGEMSIQAFLFLCGALSILVTVGILIVLGRESIALFTNQQWENSNKPLAQNLDPTSTTF